MVGSAASFVGDTAIWTLAVRIHAYMGRIGPGVADSMPSVGSGLGMYIRRDGGHLPRADGEYRISFSTVCGGVVCIVEVGAEWDAILS